MGIYKWFDEVMGPWITTLYSIPVITVVPIIIIWFGIAMISKIIVPGSISNWSACPALKTTTHTSSPERL